MKKIALSIMLILILMIVPTIIFAAEDAATLQSEVNKGGTVTLEKNVIVTNEIKVSNDVTIDFNGFNVTSEKGRVFLVEKGNVTFKGKGTISTGSEGTAAIKVVGSTDSSAQNYTVLNINENITVDATNGILVSYITYNKEKCAYGIEVNMNGTLTSVTNGCPITVNGYINNTVNYPIINIGDTAKIKGNGIYAAGYAEWNINGAEILGYGYGLGIKSGKVNVRNANVSVNGPKVIPTDGWNNGMNPSGAAIQIESNNGYAKGVQLKIENSTFDSKNSVALYEYLNSAETTTSVESLNIINTTFISGATDGDFIVSKDFNNKIKSFITAGTFSSDVTEYVAEGYKAIKMGDEYIVDNSSKIIVEEAEGGTVEVSAEKAYIGDTIKITVKPDEGYELKKLAVYEGSEKEVAVTNNEFVMPKDGVIVMAEFNKKPTPAPTPVPTPTPTPTPETPKTELTQEIDVPAEVEETEELETNLLDSLQEAIKTNSELAELVKNNNVEVKVDFNELEEKEVETAEKEKIEEAVAKEVKGIKIVKYLDITIVVKNKDKNGEVVDNLEELKEEITFTVAIPEDLPKLEEGYTRNYYIIRNHNGEIEIIKDAKLSEDGKSIIFGSSKFSTYAIGYNDVQNSGASEAIPENKGEGSSKPTENASIGPVTGDDIAIYFVSLIVSLVGIVALSVLNKSKNRH